MNTDDEAQNDASSPLSPNTLMPPSVDNIADIILDRRSVYGLNTDTLIRELANRLTARALFEMLTHMDDESPNFAAEVSALASEFSGQGITSLIALNTGQIPAADSNADSSRPPKNPTEHYLKLIFRDEQAAYYQFSLFPDLDAEYVLGAARKRAGAIQHIRLQLARPEALQLFIESCRTNPHFLRIEESTPDEFERAPSHAI